MTTHPLLHPLVLPVVLAAFLSACGGADPVNPNDSASAAATQTRVRDGGNPGAMTVDVEPVKLPTQISANAAALTGDSSTKASINAIPTAKLIAQIGLAYAQSLANSQQTRTGWLYQNDSSEYNPGAGSQFIKPLNPETTQLLVAGDAGQPLAALGLSIWRGSNVGARSAAYGTQVLDNFNGDALAAHRPVFKRVVTWLLRRETSNTLPSSVRVAFVGVNTSSSAAGMVKAGIPVTPVQCDFIATPACAANADLLVLGDVSASATLQSTVDGLLAGGKPLLYVHTHSWNGSDADNQILAAMHMQLGDYGGNFWMQDKVAAGRSTATNLSKSNQTSNYLDVFTLMASDSLSPSISFAGCTQSGCTGAAPLLGALASIRSQLNTYNSAGQNIFSNRYAGLLSLLTLTSDIQRTQIRYPMDKIANAADYAKALVADHLVAYIRASGPAQADLGSFASANIRTMPVGSSETLSITLADGSGFTALGRMAAAGKPLTVELLNPGNAKVWLRLNTVKVETTRLWDSQGYNRPRYLGSPDMLLAVGKPLQIVTPYGGTLELYYQNATPGQTVQVRVRGVGQHPFIDGTNPTNTTLDTQNFADTLNAAQHDWAEIKLFGAEIHSRADMMRTTINTSYQGNVSRYLSELKDLFIEDAYALAGYAIPGKALSAHVQSVCSQLGWNCTDARIHKAPGVQHINADLYTSSPSPTADGRSGNPYEQTKPVNPRGFVESHELGHNLQSYRHMIYGDQSVEVSNNLYPLHKQWRMLRELNDNRNPEPVNYSSAFNMIKAAQTEADPFQGAYRRIWQNTKYAAQQAEREAFYMQWVHYWAQRQGNQATGWDIITLLNLHQRQFDAASSDQWASVRNQLGYSTYTSKSNVDGNDNMLIALSWITQRDLRAVFTMWGISFSNAAANQVASYGFAAEPLFFFANTSNTNDHSTVRRVDMTVANPVWPL